MTFQAKAIQEHVPRRIGGQIPSLFALEPRLNILSNAILSVSSAKPEVIRFIRHAARWNG